MRLDADHVALDLRKKAIVKLPDAAGVTIACREGALWLTLDNDLRDVVLEPGERFTVPDHRRIMIYALKSSSLALCTPGRLPRRRVPRLPAWRRLMQAWAASGGRAIQVST